MAATNHDLEREVEAGRFRADLYYRLNVFRIRVPPLRERAGDVPVLVEHFFRQHDTSATAVSPLALRILTRSPWPGNVRQLFAALEGAWVRSGGGPIQANHLPPEIREPGPHHTSRGGVNGERYRAPESTRRGAGAADAGESERDLIIRALEQVDGVRAKAATLLGMGRTTLWRKMREYGLEDDDF